MLYLLIDSKYMHLSNHKIMFFSLNKFRNKTKSDIKGIFLVFVLAMIAVVNIINAIAILM